MVHSFSGTADYDLVLDDTSLLISEGCRGRDSLLRTSKSKLVRSVAGSDLAQARRKSKKKK